MINAAGVLFLAGEDPRNLLALLIRRTAEGDHGGEWSIPGGKIEEGETAEEAAIRECEEELGVVHFPNDLELHARRIRDGVDYTTFTCRVPEPFEVTLNEEHDSFEWVPVGSVSSVEEGRSDAAEFVESEHPRDADGKFGSGNSVSSDNKSFVVKWLNGDTQSEPVRLVVAKLASRNRTNQSDVFRSSEIDPNYKLGSVIDESLKSFSENNPEINRSRGGASSFGSKHRSIIKIKNASRGFDIPYRELGLKFSAANEKEVVIEGRYRVVSRTMVQEPGTTSEAHKVPLYELEEIDQRSDAEFNEADHPRDSDGKFGSGSNYTEYSGKIRAYNKTDPSHLKHVIAEMRKIGPPEIRVVKTKNGVTAIEGSHRLEAAKKLGLRPKVKFITPDEKVKLSDLGDIAGDVYASFTPEGGLRNGEVTGKELVEFVESGDGRNINFHKDKARFDYASPFKVIRAETVRDGEAAGYYDPTTKTIHLATHLRLGDGLRELSNPARLEAHEIGHAVDHSLGWASHDPAFTTLLESARDVLEPEEVIGADYYLGDAEEAFAEAYAYLRGPAEGARYFGTLEPGRAGEAMGEIIGWVKNRISSA